MPRTFFIPSNLEIEVLINERPPEFKPFNQDHLRYILHLISNFAAKNSDRYDDGKVELLPLSGHRIKLFL